MKKGLSSEKWQGGKEGNVILVLDIVSHANGYGYGQDEHSLITSTVNYRTYEPVQCSAGPSCICIQSNSNLPSSGLTMCFLSPPPCSGLVWHSNGQWLQSIYWR